MLHLENLQIALVLVVRDQFRVRFVLRFLVTDKQLYKRLCPSVRWSVGPSVMVIELESVKSRISAPAHPSATGIGRVSGLVYLIYLEQNGSATAAFRCIVDTMERINNQFGGEESVISRPLIWLF